MKRLSSFEGTIFFQVNSTSMCKSSDDGREATPVPIPNTEVKLSSADGSWGLPPVRVGHRWANRLNLYRLSFFIAKKAPHYQTPTVCSARKAVNSFYKKKYQKPFIIPEQCEDQAGQGNKRAKEGAYSVRDGKSERR